MWRTSTATRVLAPTEELCTPSSDFVSDLRKNATRQKHAIGYGSSTTYDKTSLTNELPYASATPAQTPKRESRVFCSRDLKLENIKVIGYDMDYTIVHQVAEWEALAHACAKACLEYLGFPVSDLEFDDPDLACRGLVIDTERGNFLKIDRHGFVRRAMHGKRRLGAEELEELYGRKLVDLRDRRFSFLKHALLGVGGRAVLAAREQIGFGSAVRDASLPFDASKVSNYADLYRAVSSALARAHGGKASPSEIKEGIAADPARYTQREPKNCGGCSRTSAARARSSPSSRTATGLILVDATPSSTHTRHDDAAFVCRRRFGAVRRGLARLI